MAIKALKLRQTAQFFPLKGSLFYQLSAYWIYLN